MTSSEEKKSTSTIKAGQERLKKPLWEGHRARLRLRMEREGWDALKPHEMVELVLFHAVPRQDLSDISRLLVDHFGSVGGVFGASREQLMQVEGMTETLTQWILTTGDLMRAYYNLNSWKGIKLNCFQNLLNFLETRIGEAGDATLWVVFSDNGYNLITYSDLSDCENWWDSENTRRMVVEAINIGARFVYLVRFLKQDMQDLDKEEKEHLEAISQTFRAVEAVVVDCVLVFNGHMRSLNAEEKLQKLRKESGCEALHEEYSRKRD